jgi:nucleoside-diphosphate-sugar epimerase
LKIAVTGAGGFIGRAVLRHLSPQHEIVAVDRSLAGLAGIEGDLRDRFVQERLVATGCDAIVHLATVPGGAAEQEPALAWQVNIDATRELIAMAVSSGRVPRFIFASSIAVFGDPLPELIDDDTPVAPRLLYGAHKAMMETWIDTWTRRGALRGLSLRLPGIVARPHGPSGMKSAFLSELFHALKARENITLPVSPAATTLLMSVDRVAINLAHALSCDAVGHVNLPALHVTMADLVTAVADATGVATDLVHWHPDPALEAQFGALPPLMAQRAGALGFTHDGTLTALVQSALAAD